MDRKGTQMSMTLESRPSVSTGHCPPSRFLLSQRLVGTSPGVTSFLFFILAVAVFLAISVVVLARSLSEQSLDGQAFNAPGDAAAMPSDETGAGCNPVVQEFRAMPLR